MSVFRKRPVLPSPACGRVGRGEGLSASAALAERPSPLPLSRSAGEGSFLQSCAGLAALEFALFAPMMVVLFFGIVEGSNAFAVSRRVSLAVNTLADLASQEAQLDAAQISDLFEGVEQIIQQGSITAEVRLVSVIIDPDTDEIVVHWSRDNSGSEPYAPGSEYTGLADPSLLDSSTSLVVGEVEYTYSSALTKRLIAPIDFNKMATRWPRRSARVQFCQAPDDCTS